MECRDRHSPSTRGSIEATRRPCERTGYGLPRKRRRGAGSPAPQRSASRETAVSVVTVAELELGVHVAGSEEVRARRLRTLMALRAMHGGSRAPCRPPPHRSGCVDSRDCTRPFRRPLHPGSRRSRRSAAGPGLHGRHRRAVGPKTMTFPRNRVSMSRRRPSRPHDLSSLPDRSALPGRDVRGLEQLSQTGAALDAVLGPAR